jgi:hypothetical protein
MQNSLTLGIAKMAESDPFSRFALAKLLPGAAFAFLGRDLKG